jgi:hypothetical protein
MPGKTSQCSASACRVWHVRGSTAYEARPENGQSVHRVFNGPRRPAEPSPLENGVRELLQRLDEWIEEADSDLIRDDFVSRSRGTVDYYVIAAKEDDSYAFVLRHDSC